MPQPKKLHRRATLAIGVSTLAASGVALAAAAALGKEAKPSLVSDGGSDKERADFLKSLVGMKLRVVGPGEVVTMEYQPDRLTIGTDGAKRIKTAYIG